MTGVPQARDGRIFEGRAKSKMGRSFKGTIEARAAENSAGMTDNEIEKLAVTAGVKQNVADKLFAKGGKSLKLRIPWITNFGPNQTSLELIQQQLKKVGIGVDLWSGPVPDFVEKQKAGDFDAAWGNLSRADGDVLRTQYSAGATDFYKIEDPELEGLLGKQLATSDGPARIALVAKVQERLLARHDEVPVHELTTILGAQPTVHGLELGADSRLDQLTSVWISK